MTDEITRNDHEPELRQKLIRLRDALQPRDNFIEQIFVAASRPPGTHQIETGYGQTTRLIEYETPDDGDETSTVIENGHIRTAISLDSFKLEIMEWSVRDKANYIDAEYRKELRLEPLFDHPATARMLLNDFLSDVSITGYSPDNDALEMKETTVV
ncbi:hypothetical protein [Acetobacter persici]|uniref:hypothetical protein n=1 Tax=Acetobacter persici TaxID=1076596 RepID=UPI0005BC8F3C|nr:hypothetical protein [Acetobacter persici]MCG0998932.1 hypothetical protein [Acetobacter persici]